MALDQSEWRNISTNGIARFKDKESREYKRRYTLNFQLKVSYVCLTWLDEASYSTVTEYAGRHIENTIDSDLQIASVWKGYFIYNGRKLFLKHHYNKSHFMYT